MVASSLVVEDKSSQCVVCSNAAAPEISGLAGVPLCCACAQLLRWLRKRLSDESGLRLNCISLSSSFAEDIRIDSLSMIELIMDLEKESGVDISDDTVAEVRTVEDVVRYVRHRSAG